MVQATGCGGVQGYSSITGAAAGRRPAQAGAVHRVDESARMSSVHTPHADVGAAAGTRWA